MARVAVEEGMESVKQALQQSGHEVVSMDNAAGCDCCVISGQDQNMMGIEDTSTQASVINADGMTDADIVQAVNQRLQ